MRTEELIVELAGQLRPVRRVRPPMQSAAIWLLLAVAVIGAGVLILGVRHDLVHRLEAGFDMPQLLFATATGVLAAIAAFHLALPDRDRRWALLPAPAAAAWLATMGWGCLEDVRHAGPAALTLSTSFSCTGFILGFGLPLTIGMLWLARHAAFLRAAPVAALGGLSAAALASVGLSLVHHLDAAVMVLVWHGVSVLAVSLLGARLGPRLMRGGLPAPA